MDDGAEDHVWRTIDPELIWVMDKLIVSRKLGYNCGPVGLDVPHPGFYIVRPCVNMGALGIPMQEGEISFNPQDYVGKPVGVELIKDKNDERYLEINKFFPVGAKKVAAVDADAETEVDKSEVPF